MSEVLVINLRNIDNINNQNKILAISHLEHMYKDGYRKIARTEKQIKRGKLISSEFDNIIYNDIYSNFTMYIDFKNLHQFDFDSLQEVFFNNKSFIDSQIKNSNAYNKIIKYVKQKISNINFH